MDDAISTASLSALPPDQDDPDVAQQVYQGREFLDHNAPTTFGEPRPHQKNLLTMAGPQSSARALAVFWKTGLGKGFTTAEILKVVVARQKAAKEKRNKVMIIVKNSVKPQWQSELAKNKEFTTAKIRDPNSKYQIQGREKAISSAISKNVHIVSLDTFALTIMNLSPEQIKEKYSCDMVVIDEVHFLRVDKDVDVSNVDDVKRWNGPIDGKIAYLMMYKFFKYAEIGLKIIATATPMYNDPIELVSIVNFILPEERKLSVAGLEHALTGGKEAIRAYLEPKLSGYVTFVSDSSGMSPIYDQGETFMYDTGEGVVESRVKIVECRMLEEQAEVYRRVLKNVEEQKQLKAEGLIKKDKKPGAFKSAVRQALNFIYLHPYDRNKNSYTGFEYFPDPDDPNNNKDGFVEMKPPKRMTKREKDLRRLNEETGRRANLGVTVFRFRYAEDLFAGLAPRDDNLQFFAPLNQERLEVIRRMSARFAKIIEIVHNDMMYEGEMEMALYYNPLVLNGGGIPLGMCFQLMGYAVEHGETDDATRMPSRPTFAYMTGDPGSTNARARNIRIASNHPSNAFGHKIAIVIASDTTSVGLSFTNARKMIHNGAVFNLPRQPEGRVNRTDSHRNFEHDYQKFVRRYYMACVLPNGEQTADHKMWWDVQLKEDRIIPTEDVLHEISWDAGLYPGRTREGFKGLPTIFTRYHLHHAEREYYEIEKEVRRAFLIKPAWTFSELRNLMGFDHRPDTLCWCLRGMLDRRDVIADRFGFMKVMREDNGLYFLGDVAETLRGHQDSSTHSRLKHDVLQIGYSTGFRFAMPGDFRTISTQMVQDVEGNDDEALATDMLNWQRGDVEMGHKRMLRLEQALLGKIKNSEIKKFILSDLAVTWFYHNDHYFHYLDEMRPKGNEGAYQYNRRRIDSGDEVPLIRVAKKGDKEFRKATVQETIAYATIINKRWQDRDDDIAARKTFTFTVVHNISSDREIRIRDDLKVKKTRKGDIDERTVKGKLVSLLTPLELVDAMYQIGVENPNAEKNRTSKQQLKKEVSGSVGNNRITNMDEDKMAFYHGWMSGLNKFDREVLVAKLVEFMKVNDFLLVK